MSSVSIATKDSSLFCNFIEDYFYSLPSQGNIYTLLTLKNKNGSCKFLVASLQKKIFCLEYTATGSYSLTEVPLPSIPNGADIISMDAVSSSKAELRDLFSVGVSFCKKDGVEIIENCLNIYSNLDIHSNKEFDIPISCCSLNLQYMPYQLYHTHVASDIKKSNPVWILCGSDSVVHLYKPGSDSPHSYEEVSCLDTIFPEFSEAHEITVRLDIYYASDMKSRITAMCGDRGNVLIFFVDLCDSNLPIIKNKRHLCFDFPSSCSKFFKQCSYRSHVSPFDEDNNFDVSQEKLDDSLHAVVATTLESCFIYRDIERDPFGFQLPQSENYDVVTSCLVCDVDFDGINEVLLGTYGQTVLIYHESHEEGNPWILSKTLSFSSPVLSLAYEDFHGDGIHELVVHTMAGVHIYQHDPVEISSLLLERLQSMVSRRQAESVQ